MCKCMTRLVNLGANSFIIDNIFIHVTVFCTHVSSRVHACVYVCVSSCIYKYMCVFVCLAYGFLDAFVSDG